MARILLYALIFTAVWSHEVVHSILNRIFNNIQLKILRKEWVVYAVEFAILDFWLITGFVYWPFILGISIVVAAWAGYLSEKRLKQLGVSTGWKTVPTFYLSNLWGPIKSAFLKIWRVFTTFKAFFASNLSQPRAPPEEDLSKLREDLILSIGLLAQDSTLNVAEIIKELKNGYELFGFPQEVIDTLIDISSQYEEQISGISEALWNMRDLDVNGLKELRRYNKSLHDWSLGLHRAMRKIEPYMNDLIYLSREKILERYFGKYIDESASEGYYADQEAELKALSTFENVINLSTRLVNINNIMMSFMIPDNLRKYDMIDLKEWLNDSVHIWTPYDNPTKKELQISEWISKYYGRFEVEIIVEDLVPSIRAVESLLYISVERIILNGFKAINNRTDLQLDLKKIRINIHQKNDSVKLGITYPSDMSDEKIDTLFKFDSKRPHFSGDVDMPFVKRAIGKSGGEIFARKVEGQNIDMVEFVISFPIPDENDGGSESVPDPKPDLKPEPNLTQSDSKTIRNHSADSQARLIPVVRNYAEKTISRLKKSIQSARNSHHREDLKRSARLAEWSALLLEEHQGASVISEVHETGDIDRAAQSAMGVRFAQILNRLLGIKKPQSNAERNKSLPEFQALVQDLLVVGGQAQALGEINITLESILSILGDQLEFTISINNAEKLWNIGRKSVNSSLEFETVDIKDISIFSDGVEELGGVKALSLVVSDGQNKLTWLQNRQLLQLRNRIKASGLENVYVTILNQNRELTETELINQIPEQIPVGIIKYVDVNEFLNPEKVYAINQEIVNEINGSSNLNLKVEAVWNREIIELRKSAAGRLMITIYQIISGKEGIKIPLNHMERSIWEINVLSVQA